MQSPATIERIIAAATRVAVALAILTHLGIWLSLAGSKAPAELVGGMLQSIGVGG
jgi:hypothetical protein